MSEQPSTYYTPAHIVNPGTGTGDMTPAAELVNPPYYIEGRTQRLARLGLKLAGLVARMNDDMPYQQAANLADEIEKTAGEILQVGEGWEPSNE